MPVKNGIGYGQYTLDKQFGLEMLFKYHMSVVREVLGNHPNFPQIYHYIDTNAGSGHNEELDCDGSPLIYEKEIRQIGIGGKSWLIEREPENADILRDLVGGEIIIGDNRDVLHGIIARLPWRAFGLLYHDPNTVPDFDLLTKACRNSRMYKMDILIRCSGTSIKRARSAYPDKFCNLQEYLSKINKKYWLVRRLAHGDRHQWTFLFGTNWKDIKDWKKRGFYRIDSAEGKQILHTITYTAPEKASMGQQTFVLEEA